MQSPLLLPDRMTLVAISSLAYVLAVGLHEHLGHSAACVLLGSHATELGAFYVNCDDSRLSSLGVRLVELAGPLVSLLTGVLSFLILRRRVPRDAPAAYYFFWLLGSIGLMDAAGYPLFSGVSGVGDLGVDPNGALYGASPPWLWRVALTIAGAFAYYRAIKYSLRAIEPRAAGRGAERIHYARRVALTSYITGAMVYLAIGLLNPYGWVIVASSALASSMGGTSGLLWMMQRLDPAREGSGSGLYFPRSWSWIAVATAVTLAYAAVLGPTR
jgi:hypothetical protein